MDMCGCEPGFHRHPMSAPDVTLVLTGCMAVINITKLAEKNSKETRVNISLKGTTVKCFIPFTNCF
jgi:hypothetical protein